MVAVLLVILFRRCLNEDDVSFHADVVGKHSVMLIGSPKDISSVFSVPVRRENRIYPCLYDEELQKIIAVIDTGTEKGKRDMAMILLGVSVGMRAIDIINLKLTDIDWAHGEIHLVQKKIGQSVFLPLMPDAGKAIADYILNARPSVKTDYIFLTLNYPARKFTDDTGKGDIWNGYTGPAGIKRSAFDRKSFHSLRRRVATKMVVAGIPVTTISQVLGQKRMDSANLQIGVKPQNEKIAFQIFCASLVALWTKTISSSGIPRRAGLFRRSS